MGNVLSYFKKPRKILILGPRNSGRTSVFTHVAQVYKCLPKISVKKHFNFLKIRNCNIWDLASEYEACWCFYYDNAAAVVFVFDVTDTAESMRLLEEACYAKELRNSIFLLILNKIEDVYGDVYEDASQLLKYKKHCILRLCNNADLREIETGINWIFKHV
ncbi:ADP-ribosylation factor-like protein 1 [Enteropsectra breve]|nr:ADP-ribosylation factor-like protein 1 [Enteropsectra breve]KAI5152221.1 ADP-ribosylation factor-like protein 1 [Enteropsectra breve]KAI5153181.1 ADP-ribosylation factor-like protein 1 [Enteropsectra breve]